MTATDRSYYQQRVRDERASERAATTPAAAKAHAELAEEYERLLKALDSEKGG